MDKFVLNLIHRPEMVPEYAEKVTGHGKTEYCTRYSWYNMSPAGFPAGLCFILKDSSQ